MWRTEIKCITRSKTASPRTHFQCARLLGVISMKFENEFCGACHCSGNGKFDYGPYLFCPACGHIYIWSLKSNLNHFFVETFPLEIRKRRKRLHEYEKQTKEEFGVICLK